MMSTRIIEFSAPEVSRREILRYMGCKESSPDAEALIDRGLAECYDKLSYKVAYSFFPVREVDDGIDLGFARSGSRDLIKALDGCDSIILFAATLGLEIDRAINKYGRISPSLAVCLQAIGAERIESLCDAFCEMMKAQHRGLSKVLMPRFSAGYGDIPLSLQKDIFRALCCEKNLGLTLNDSLLMSPTKSVTAMIGIKTNKD